MHPCRHALTPGTSSTHVSTALACFHNCGTALNARALPQPNAWIQCAAKALLTRGCERQEERAGKEAVEAALAEARAEAEQGLTSARADAAEQLQSEAGARQEVEAQLAAVRGHLQAANAATEAAKAQLQAHQISAEQKRTALQKERADIEVITCMAVEPCIGVWSVRGRTVR